MKTIIEIERYGEKEPKMNKTGISTKRGLPKRAPTHPGAILREDVLPELKISKAEFARSINVSRQMLYDILNESRPITTAMALRLGKVLGNGPTVWIGMQQKYDLYHTAQDMAEELGQMKVMHG